MCSAQRSEKGPMSFHFFTLVASEEISGQLSSENVIHLVWDAAGISQFLSHFCKMDKVALL